MTGFPVSFAALACSCRAVGWREGQGQAGLGWGARTPHLGDRSKVPAWLTSWGDAGESWAELGVPSQRGGCNQPFLCEEALFGAWWLGQGELGTGGCRRWRAGDALEAGQAPGPGGGELRSTCFCERFGLGPGQLAPGIAAHTCSDKQAAGTTASLQRAPSLLSWGVGWGPLRAGGLRCPKTRAKPSPRCCCGAVSVLICPDPKLGARPASLGAGACPKVPWWEEQGGFCPAPPHIAGWVRGSAPFPSSKGEEVRIDKDLKRALHPWALQPHDNSQPAPPSGAGPL